MLQRTRTSLADECRERAAECTERASQEEDPQLKLEYSDLATMWRLIAINSEETEYPHAKERPLPLFCSVR